MAKGSFTVDVGFIERWGRKAAGVIKDLDVDFEKKMNKAVDVVYKTATARRPMMVNKKGKRVSDPSATLGVPVAAKGGGTLRASIKKEVKRKGDKFTGRIYTDLYYAPYLEFGTSKMDARPFMRPALFINKDFIEKTFNQPPELKL